MEQLKKWVEKKLESDKRWAKSREDMLSACKMVLGAVQFAIDSELVEYDEIEAWWNTIREAYWHGPFGEE